jgi:hypothetical protein
MWQDFAKETKYSIHSLIRLQLIRMSHNPDRNMKKSVHSCVHTSKRHVEFRSKRTFRLCWGQLERLKPRKKISKIGFSWMKETLDFSFLSFYSYQIKAIYLWLYSPFIGPWPIFQFLNPIHSRWDSSDGGLARRKAATYTEQTHRHPHLEWDSNPRSQRSSERRHFMP